MHISTRMSYHLTPIMTTIKKAGKNKCRRCEKMGICIALGKVKSYSVHETYEGRSLKIKHWITIRYRLNMGLLLEFKVEILPMTMVSLWEVNGSWEWILLRNQRPALLLPWEGTRRSQPFATKKRVLLPNWPCWAWPQTSSSRTRRNTFPLLIGYPLGFSVIGVRTDGHTVWSSNSTCGNIYKKLENRISKKCLHTCVHRSIIYNNIEVEITQMLAERWLHKQNVVNTYNKI